MPLELPNNRCSLLYSARKNVLDDFLWNFENNPDLDVNQRPEHPNSYTALHWATYNGNTQMVELLLDHGADPNLYCRLGMTPLHIAACWNFPDIAELLIRNGADVNMPALPIKLNLWRDYPHLRKHVFIKPYDEELEEEYLKYLDTGHWRHWHGDNPLNNKNINNIGIRPLHLVDSAYLIGARYYCRKRLPNTDFKCPSLLIEFFKKHFYKRPMSHRSRPDVDELDLEFSRSDNKTIKSSDPELAKHLLKAGAKTNVYDEYHQSPLDWVKASGNRAIQFDLLEASESQ